jgi:uncharacterized coiled-coil DUF342 family protein
MAKVDESQKINEVHAEFDEFFEMLNKFSKSHTDIDEESIELLTQIGTISQHLTEIVRRAKQVRMTKELGFDV